MVFNYLIDNKDDHAKNFAFIYRAGDWHFVPAYDLLPSDGINEFRTTSINDSIEPVKEDLLSVAVKAGLDKKEIVEVFEKIEKCVRRFLSHLNQSECFSKECWIRWGNITNTEEE